MKKLLEVLCAEKSGKQAISRKKDTKRPTELGRKTRGDGKGK